MIQILVKVSRLIVVIHYVRGMEAIKIIKSSKIKNLLKNKFLTEGQKFRNKILWQAMDFWGFLIKFTKIKIWIKKSLKILLTIIAIQRFIK